ncbi:MAG TPA: YjzC family protein [Candidatus Paenibacillus intestinavium]|nr:YjzC family protein [Candidatus Paenibacillus intestinavium]
MGEKTVFSAGEKAPNTATYIEIGEKNHVMGVKDPLQITLSAGDEFPNTSNHNRKWSKKERN